MIQQNASAVPPDYTLDLRGEGLKRDQEFIAVFNGIIQMENVPMPIRIVPSQITKVSTDRSNGVTSSDTKVIVAERTRLTGTDIPSDQKRRCVSASAVMRLR